LYLLRMAVGQAVNESMSLAPDEWRAVYRLAKKHAVIGVAWDGIERLQQMQPEALQSMPADVAGKWFADVQTIEAANRKLAKLAQAVQVLLRTGGYEAQVLKGAALAAYYPKPEHRQATDVDMWVRPQDYKRLANELCRGDNSHNLKALRQELLSFLQKQSELEIGEVVYHHIETQCFGDTEVEMHITPTWLCNPRHNRHLQRAFAEAGQMTPELEEVYALLHGFRHIYHDGLALRHVMDYYLVCRHNRMAGVLPPQAMYDALGLRRFAEAMDEVAAAIFAAGEPQQLSKRAQHILDALPKRQVSNAVRWDYPEETLFNLPWRVVHYLWRKKNHYV